jgi:hypothetical protein
MLSFSSIKLLIGCTSPFPCVYLSFLCSLLYPAERWPFFAPPSAGRTIYPIIFPTIFAFIFLYVASLVLPIFYFFDPRSFLSNDMAKLDFYSNLIDKYPIIS